MKDITIKQVMDKEGDFSHLELWQGDSMITISLAATQLDTQFATYKWQNLQQTIEKIKANMEKPVEATH